MLRMIVKGYQLFRHDLSKRIEQSRNGGECRVLHLIIPYVAA